MRNTGGGSGEPNDPYLIYTAEQMNAIGTEPNDWDKQFKLMADIDLSTCTGSQFNIIGGNSAFTGVFDGDGHTISNFTYVSTDPFVGGGLFGSVNDPNAEIKNLRLIDPNVVAEDGGGVGLLIASLSQGLISNCHVENGHVAGFWSVGGLVGAISGDVEITREIGVIRRGEGILRYCSTNGVHVSGDRQVGGLVGSHYRGTIAHCHSTGTVFGDELVGGLVGENLGTISDCFSTALVIGEGLVGGLVGHNGAGANGRIMRCYSSGGVSGDWAIGGLVGMSSTRISNCYSVGSVTGTTGVGGLIGSGKSTVVTYSFWDTETSGQSTSDGGTGKTTAEMQTASTFLEAGWDFVDEVENGTNDIWWILEGREYPRLWWDWLLVQVVDDFESYNDIELGLPGGNPIYDTWFEPFLPHTWNGANIGYTVPFEPTMETVIVHSGNQSAPMLYRTTGLRFSVVVRTFSPAQDWIGTGATMLSLWFYGDPANTHGQMYVKINGVKIVYDGDQDDLTRPAWNRWDVDLTAVDAGLSNVTTLAIGVDGFGATGTLLLDDIELYASAPGG
jgi:hypothetical protein